MSFFADLVTPFLIEKISRAYENSAALNSISRFVCLFGNGENAVLLTDRYHALVGQLRRLNKSGDALMLRQIVSDLQAFCRDINLLSSGRTAASLSTTMLQIERALTCFYSKLETLGLLDMQPDDSPAAILRQCLVHYLYEKIAGDYDGGFFEHEPNPATSAMARQKELLVAEALQNLTMLGPKPSAKTVLECIRNLQTKNEKLREEHSVSLGFFSIQPGKGLLDTHAEDAVTQITRKYSGELIDSMTKMSAH